MVTNELMQILHELLPTSSSQVESVSFSFINTILIDFPSELFKLFQLYRTTKPKQKLKMFLSLRALAYFYPLPPKEPAHCVLFRLQSILH